MDNTLLFSTSELSTLRTNKKARRQLELVHNQLEQERKYVSNDWNRRMRTFITQKKRFMPKDWDHTAYRPNTSVARGVASTGEFGGRTINGTKIPRTWQLKNCYIKYADGRLEQRPSGAVSARRAAPFSPTCAAGHSTRALSAPGGHHRRPPVSETNKPQSALPRTRRPLTGHSFLVTQLAMEEAVFNSDDDEDQVFSMTRHNNTLNSKTSNGQRNSVIVNSHDPDLQPPPRDTT